MDSPLLIAGLGNPGPQYARNRHNAGFIVVDEIHAAHGFGPWRLRFSGLLSEGRLGGRKTFLLKPQTYMNLSGDSVGAALRFFKLPLEALVVIHDDIDLGTAKLKVKAGGGDAGQNGLKSITAVLGPDYRRVRVGIGRPAYKAMVKDYVLGNFGPDEIAELKPLVMAMVEAAPLLARDADNSFMNKVTLKVRGTKEPPPKDTKPENTKKDET